MSGARWVALAAALALLSACSGKPGSREAAEAVSEGVKGGLTVGGFPVPAEFVSVEDIEVGEIRKVRKSDEGDVYAFRGEAVVELTASGMVIAEGARSGISQTARNLDWGNMGASIMGAARARSALRDVPQGASYRVAFEAAIRDVDGDFVLIDGRTDPGVPLDGAATDSGAADRQADAGPSLWDRMVGWFKSDESAPASASAQSAPMARQAALEAAAAVQDAARQAEDAARAAALAADAAAVDSSDASARAFDAAADAAEEAADAADAVNATESAVDAAVRAASTAAPVARPTPLQADVQAPRDAAADRQRAWLATCAEKSRVLVTAAGSQVGLSAQEATQYCGCVYDGTGATAAIPQTADGRCLDRLL